MSDCGLAPDPALGGSIRDPALSGALPADPPFTGAVVVETEIDVDLGAGQGMAGPPGPPPDDLTFVTVSPLSGHRAVYVRSDGALDYASADLPECLDAFVGVTTGAAATGSPIVVRAGGEMVEPSWSWTVGPVWLGLGGQLTQADPAESVALLVGVALAATRRLIIPEPAIRPG